MNHIHQDPNWIPNPDQFTTPWGPPPPAPESQLLHPHPRAERRNLADHLWLSPELLPIRATDHTPRQAQEPTDHTPQSRTFARRLLGALAAPLTAISREMDTLPLNLRVDSAQKPWLHYLLHAGGLPAVEGTPTHMLRRMLRNIDHILPLGRSQTRLRLIEALLGRAGHTTSTQTAPDGTITLTTTLTTPDGDTYTLTETLPVQTPNSITSARSVTLTVPANCPEWLERQLAALTPAHFTPNIQRQP